MTDAAVASEVCVLCGNYMNKWIALVFSFDILFQNHVEFDSIAGEVSPPSSGYHQAVLIDTIRKNVKEGGSARFQHMPFHNRTCESVDPLDRVFAVLDLVGTNEIKGLEPDYSIKKEEGFKAVVDSVIHNTRSLDVLSARQNYEKRASLPSWVPNLGAGL